MSKPITAEDLYTILQGYEDKLRRLENRLANQPDTPTAGIVAYAAAISTDANTNVNATNPLPPGFLYCNGDAVSRADFAPLFAKIGTIYGSGDGSTTFNLPDLRGRLLTGVTYLKGGETGPVSTAQDAIGENDGQVIAKRRIHHSHTNGLSIVANGAQSVTLSQFGAYTGRGYGTGWYQASDGWNGGYNHNFGTAPNHGHSMTGNIGDTGGPNDTPAYSAVHYLIKT